MDKIKVVMNKPVELGQALLDLSKIVMYEFHYEYMVPKYGENLTLCYMDTDSLVYRIKTEDFDADIADDVQTRFDTSGYCSNRPLPIGLNKKVIGLMKDELGGAIMTEFAALRPKLYSYRKLDGSEDKKCKGIKKCVVKKTLTFEDYKNCLFKFYILYSRFSSKFSGKCDLKSYGVLNTINTIVSIKWPYQLPSRSDVAVEVDYSTHNLID